MHFSNTVSSVLLFDSFFFGQEKQKYLSRVKMVQYYDCANCLYDKTAINRLNATYFDFPIALFPLLAFRLHVPHSF